MKQINLYNLTYFNNQAHLNKLNRLIQIREKLMIHDIAIATGCEFQDAAIILFYLYNYYVAEMFLIVYHNKHLDPPVPSLVRKFLEGFPQFPFTCSVCEEEVVSSAQVTYEFMASLKETVEFISEKK